jgi:hypothetical protein
VPLSRIPAERLPWQCRGARPHLVTRVLLFGPQPLQQRRGGCKADMVASEARLPAGQVWPQNIHGRVVGGFESFHGCNTSMLMFETPLKKEDAYVRR